MSHISHHAVISSALTLSIILTSFHGRAQEGPQEQLAPPATASTALPTQEPAVDIAAPTSLTAPPPDNSFVQTQPEGLTTPQQTSSLAQAPAPTDAAETTPEVTSEPPTAINEHVKLGGGAIIYYYQPTKEGRGTVGVFFANLLLDAQWDIFGFHIEPRFRDARLRPFFDGPAWIQEAYASASFVPITVKVGKIYKRSNGLFWDNSFFGNVQVYDGLKLDPNYGVSVEGSVGHTLGLDFAAQYFIVDGLTNVSLQGRDTFSTPGARRRHTKAAKAEPWLKINDSGEVRFGGSVEHFVADIPQAHDRVLRVGADLKFTYDLGDAGSTGIWGEYVHQSGRHVVDHPETGNASNDTDYFLVGAQYSLWKLTLRYNFSHANYKTVDIEETLHVPGIGFAFNEHLTLLTELAHWRQDTPTGRIPYNDSVNVTLSGRF